MTLITGKKFSTNNKCNVTGIIIDHHAVATELIIMCQL